MSTLSERLDRLLSHKENASLRIKTFGTFEASLSERTISGKAWGRDKTIQLFQFLITNKSRKSLHKEQIINRLWEEADEEEGDRDFKVALHGIHKVLEPERKPRTDPKYILRQGNSYQLNESEIWIDADAFERLVALGNEALTSEVNLAISAFRNALELHHGVYLPNRIFEDWTSEKREGLNVMAMGACLSLAELLLKTNPSESLQLATKALSLDNTWEDAYQMQMRAYIQNGNRPGAIRAYRDCVKVLDEEFGLDPLPETQKLYDSIIS